MEQMHLWCVTQRRNLKNGQKKVNVFRFIVMETTGEKAIELVEKDEQDTDNEYRYKAFQIDADGCAATFNIGCYLADATEEDRALRAQRRKAEEKM